MQKILGLDLGTNSIGWAIRNTGKNGNQIIEKGVLTFEKGVGEEKGIEVPLVKKRTESRSKRRNYQAEKYRKWELLKCLIENDPKMCPLTLDELNLWRRYDKKIGRVYPFRKEFTDWLKLDFNADSKVDYENPYHLRKIVSEGKMDNPEIIGRALYHLVQRRGFRGRDEAESEKILLGSEETGTVGADAIHKIMQEHNLTLGGALYYDLKNNGKRARKRYNLRIDFENELKKICEVQDIEYTSDLFKKLYKAIIWQRPLRSQKGNVGLCTYERNSYVDKKIGKEYTIGKPRCPISHPLYEEYRAWCFINNIKIKPLDKPKGDYFSLSKEQRNKIFEKLFFRKSKPTFDFSDIVKVIDPKKNTYLFNYKNNVSVSANPVTTGLRELFGELEKIKCPHIPNEKRKGKKEYYSYEDIWHVLFTFDSKDKLVEFGRDKLKLNDELANKFSNIKLKQGYASLSLYAIKKILQYLRKGFIYSDAVYLANINKVLSRELNDEEEVRIIDGFRTQFRLQKEEQIIIGAANNLIAHHLNLSTDEHFGRYPKYLLTGKDHEDIEHQLKESFGGKTWDEMDEEIKNKYSSRVKKLYHAYLQLPGNVDKSLIFNKAQRLDDRIKCYLKNEWGAKEENLKYLYHPSETDFYPPAQEEDGVKYLGDPMPLSRGFKNPMAMKTLHHLKRFINYLLEENKIDEETRIVVEIARELNDANRRKAIEKWQRDREKQNKEYSLAIKELAEQSKLDIDYNKDYIIDKYRLWIEQDRQCIYTGKIINCTSLFDGLKFDFEHTIPADISFDNELKNLTIADSMYNREIKQKRIPFELPNYENDTEIGGNLYTAIKPRLKFIEEKVNHFSNQIEFWKKQSKAAETKERKDHCIQQKHYDQLEYDYWKKKYETFIIKEFKSGWRNSQLRDTQLITKYALHYLKTVFNKVDVQKGTITAEFRKIFNVGFEKDRTKHSHHAVDAAILTLIPSAIIRDKLLKEHFEALENNIRFHSIPSEWKNYNPQAIQEIESSTLINYINQDRRLTHTKKLIRKRGRVQFLQETNLEGKVIYRRDEKGNKIPFVADGDSIRGQLHKETFYGAIKKQGNDKLTFVERILLKDLEEKNLEKIIDKNVREVIKNTIKERMDQGKSFKEAIAEDIWMIGKNGVSKKTDKRNNRLFPIRHVRCEVKIGGGSLSEEKALQIKEHLFLSKHDYKHYIYALNEEMSVCLFYEGNVNGTTQKAFRFIGLFELANYKLKSLSDLYKIPEFQFCELGRGKNKYSVPLVNLITNGMRVLVYSSSPDELRELNKTELLKRVYKIYKFNKAPVPIIYLRYHNEARSDSEIQKSFTQIEISIYQPLLKLVANNFKCLIEGKDFIIKPDGEIIIH